MYLIVHDTLGMGVGKTAAQCAHASQMLTLYYFELKKNLTKYRMQIISLVDGAEKEAIKNLRAEASREVSIFGEWMASSFRKVVLRASDKEWEKIKDTIPMDMRVMVVDAGLTQIAPGSETVIGLWPMRKSQVPKTVKRLQVLK
jgi:peptidyl-tRNA hydrolase